MENYNKLKYIKNNFIHKTISRIIVLTSVFPKQCGGT